jgi:ASC-1-like (ASCH) protein
MFDEKRPRPEYTGKTQHLRIQWKYAAPMLEGELDFTGERIWKTVDLRRWSANLSRLQPGDRIAFTISDPPRNRERNKIFVKDVIAVRIHETLQSVLDTESLSTILPSAERQDQLVEEAAKLGYTMNDRYIAIEIPKPQK